MAAKKYIELDGLKAFWAKALNAITSTFETLARVTSRGDQLITNGSGLTGDNTNWHLFDFDGAVSNFSGGSFTKALGYYGTINLDDLIMVNPNEALNLSIDIKSANGLATFYCFLNMYDVDKKTILAPHVMYVANTTTTLARDLKDGDTVVYLTSVANWGNNYTQTYRRGLIFWNYANSKGYTYPEKTYSRNSYADLFDIGAIDASTNTITLRSPWNKGTFAAGTSVSQRDDGGQYQYWGIVGGTLKTDWTTYKATFSGIDTTGRNSGQKMRYGTAYVGVGFLWNYNHVSDKIWVTNLCAYASRAASVLTTARTFWGVSFDGSADVTTAPNLYIGTTKVQTSSAAQDLSGVKTITATALVKSGGTSGQFLKADGSVDSNSYATTAQLNGKQATITDLADIRSGASKGSTALQPASINDRPKFTPAGEGEGVPDPPFGGGGSSEGGATVDVIDSLTSDSSTSALSAKQGKALKALIDAIKVFSGSYNDLTDKPTIPTHLSQLTADATHRTVTDAEKTAWNGKVDKVSGKGLSTEDFTTALKTKLEGLSNYNDSEVRGLITSLNNALDALTGTGNTTEAIDTMNEIMAFLENYKNTDNLASVLQTLQSTIEGWVEAKGYLTSFTESDPTVPSHVKSITAANISAWNGKQDAIANLSTIIANAANGATAYGYFTNGKLPYSSVSGTPSIPSALSGLTDDATHRLVTDEEKNAWSGKQDAISDLEAIRSGAAAGATALQSFTESDPTVPAHVKSITEADITSWNGKQASISDLATIRSNASNGATAYGYFTSGKLPWGSISGAPTIPAAQVQSDWNATSGMGVILNKPTIPTITDTYSSTSSNGMSGKAVASAISGVRQVPSASTSNNGQVLSVVNGVPTWVSTVTVYSGSEAPANSLGNDGDIYIQA